MNTTTTAASLIDSLGTSEFIAFLILGTFLWVGLMAGIIALVHGGLILHLRERKTLRKGDARRSAEQAEGQSEERSAEVAQKFLANA